jgi:protein-S-isoprenylcysteine O-methyltransferase Ste14
MDNRISETQMSKSDAVSAGIKRRLIQLVISLLVMAAILFLSAGRLTWTAAWVYLALNLAVILVNTMVILQKNRELVAERSQMRAEAKAWDKILGPLAAVVGPLIIWIVSGLDARYGWTPAQSSWLPLLGAVGIVGGMALTSWAMVSNPFFATLVAIQTDRGHTVAVGGPYRWLRHPGYAGFILSYLGVPLLLGSNWALIPAEVTTLFVIIRTALEDATLQNELTGYRDYAGRVRYRLIPGLW